MKDTTLDPGVQSVIDDINNGKMTTTYQAEGSQHFCLIPTRYIVMKKENSGVRKTIMGALYGTERHLKSWTYIVTCLAMMR